MQFGKSYNVHSRIIENCNFLPHVLITFKVIFYYGCTCIKYSKSISSQLTLSSHNDQVLHAVSQVSFKEKYVIHYSKVQQNINRDRENMFVQPVQFFKSCLFAIKINVSNLQHGISTCTSQTLVTR